MLHMQNYCITRENIQIQHGFTMVNKKIKILHNIPINVQKKKKDITVVHMQTIWYYHVAYPKQHGFTTVNVKKKTMPLL